jgi:hypothetical protein
MSGRDRASEGDRHVDAEQVRREHMDAVDERHHVLYLAGVLGGATLLMVVLLLILDAMA